MRKKWFLQTREFKSGLQSRSKICLVLKQLSNVLLSQTVLTHRMIIFKDIYVYDYSSYIGTQDRELANLNIIELKHLKQKWQQQIFINYN